MGAEFLTTLCALYSFINALKYRIVKERNILMVGGRKTRLCGEGGGINWS